MSTNAEVHLAIETRMHQQWVNQDVRVRYENESRKIPAGPFVRVVIRTQRAFEVGYAGNKIRYRRPGTIIAQCFVVAKTGTQVARDLADTVIGIFEGQQFDDLTCEEGWIEELGDDGNGFWQVNARINFDFDFQRSY